MQFSVLILSYCREEIHRFFRRPADGELRQQSFSNGLTFLPSYVIFLKKITLTKNWRERNEKNSYSENQKPLRVRKERRLRRMPDLLPVRLQDQLRHRKSEMRKKRKEVKHRRKGRMNMWPFFVAPDSRPAVKNLHCLKQICSKINYHQQKFINYEYTEIQEINFLQLISCS